MRISLFAKVIIGYLIFGVLGFVAISIFSSSIALTVLEEDHAEQLYNEASLIAETCREEYTASHLSLEEMGSQLSRLSSVLDATVWLVEKDGTVVYRSDKGKTGVVLKSFRVSQGKRDYTIGTCEGLLSEDMLCLSAPISANYKIYGYVSLQQPMRTIYALRDDVMVIIYVTYLIMMVLAIGVVLIIHHLIFRPIQKITSAAVAYAAGNLKYDLHLNHDNEIGYLADTLNYMAHELSNKEEDQKKFISNVSHDFRSPLTSIKGYLEAMLDGTIPPELHEKYMRRVIAETERLTKLTSSTLALQTMDHKGNMLDPTDFDINQVIRDTVGTFEGSCMPRGITFDLIFAEKTFRVHADLGKIQQVLYNLIDNAVKFSKNNETIWIETRERRDKIYISVKDGGQGIPKESLSKIWERFYKSDTSRGKDKSGTGLGLSITKEIINAHGETIDVISTEGIGTEFIFTLQKAEKSSVSS